MQDTINPPAIVRPAADLAALAHRINDEHAAVEDATRSKMEHALAAGKLLHEVKAVCGHGKFGAWLKTNVKFTPRTAQNYMRLATKYETVSHLTDYSEALRILAAKDRATKAEKPATTSTSVKAAPDREQQVVRLKKLATFATKLVSPEAIEINLLREFSFLPAAQKQKELERVSALIGVLETLRQRLAA